VQDASQLKSNFESIVGSMVPSAIALGLQQQKVQDASQLKSNFESIGWKHGGIALGLQQQEVQDGFCVELSSWKHGAVVLN